MKANEKDHLVDCSPLALDAKIEDELIKVLGINQMGDCLWVAIGFADSKACPICGLSWATILSDQEDS